jgi:hypothetical protein
MSCTVRTSALSEEAADDRLQIVRVRAVQTGQFVG